MTPENRVACIYNYVKGARLSLEICAAMTLANAAGPQQITEYADDSLDKRALLALPSALVTPAVTGNLAADIGLQVVETADTVEIVRRTSTTRELLGSAIVAQALASSTDVVAEQSGWLNPTERAQPDIGFSAISTAWFSKFFLDRADRARTPLRKGLWRMGMVLYANIETTGYFLLNGANTDRLDLTSHASGVVVGIGAYFLGKQGDRKIRIYYSSDLEA